MAIQERRTRITATTEIREHLAKVDPIIDAVIEKYDVIDYELTRLPQ
jgi:3-hydroxyacyl-CoA dehydrogenase